LVILLLRECFSCFLLLTVVAIVNFHSCFVLSREQLFDLQTLAHICFVLVVLYFVFLLTCSNIVMEFDPIHDIITTSATLFFMERRLLRHLHPLSFQLLSFVTKDCIRILFRFILLLYRNWLLVWEKTR
jgi:hypothetical protein